MTSTGTSKVPNPVEGLPKQFVTSLRILFDILDEDRTGYVRLCDIESRWHEEGVRGLPSGVIESLKKVAPRNGRLTFENFVTGLKLSLLKTPSHNVFNTSTPLNGKENKGPRNNERTSERPQPVKSREVSKPRSGQTDGHQQINNHKDRQIHGQKQRAPGVRSQPQMGIQRAPSTNTATVRPNNVLQSQNIELRNQIYTRDQLQQANVRLQQKPEPPPYREPEKFDSRFTNNKRHGEGQFHTKEQQHQPKPRPKSAQFETHRAKEVHIHSRSHEFPAGRPERPPPYQKPEQDAPPTVPPRNMHGLIIHELKNWQKANSQSKDPRLQTTNSDSKLMEKKRLSYAGNEIYVNIDQIRKHTADNQNGGAQTKSSVRRQNSRRHTLSSGVDYNVIRRMKQLEREKDVLLQGLEVVDRTREWYLKQIAIVAEKQNFAEKTSCSDVTLQTNQEKMDFISGRIMEVNLNLKSLMESSEVGFPAHMNLAVRGNVVPDQNTVKWLKDQNKQLTQEVGTKSEKITQLEKEKTSLIRDLFEARTKHKASYDDTTFM